MPWKEIVRGPSNVAEKVTGMVFYWSQKVL